MPNEGFGTGEKKHYSAGGHGLGAELVAVERHVEQCGARLSDQTGARSSTRSRQHVWRATNRHEMASRCSSMSQPVRSPSSNTKRACSTTSVHITNQIESERTRITMRYPPEQSRSPQPRRVGQRDPWQAATDFRAALDDYRATQPKFCRPAGWALRALVAVHPPAATPRPVGHPQSTSHSPLKPVIGWLNTSQPHVAAHPANLRRCPCPLTLVRADQESESARR